MLSLEHELVELRQRGAIDDRECARLVALERGDIFPIAFELRAAAYIAVAMIVTGIGMVIAHNLERIGPLSIAVALALAALGCYVPAIRSLRRNEPRTAVGEYVLLLGALLLAADVGFIESTFHPLGGLWALHLLLIAVLHALGAYIFNSKLLLSASLASLASWFGFQSGAMFNDSSVSVGSGGLCAAITIAIWRAINSRYPRYRDFAGTFDFFIANVALISAIILSSDDDTKVFGLIFAAIFATASIVYGVVTRSISFAVYGVIFGVITAGIAAFAIGAGFLGFLFITLFAAVGGAVLLAYVRQMIRRPA